MVDTKHTQRETSPVLAGERILVLSLGLLVAGSAHAYVGDSLGQDCRQAPGNERSKSQNHNDKSCREVKSTTKGKSRQNDSLATDLRGKNPDELTSHAKLQSPQNTYTQDNEKNDSVVQDIDQENSDSDEVKGTGTADSSIEDNAATQQDGDNNQDETSQAAVSTDEQTDTDGTVTGQPDTPSDNDETEPDTEIASAYDEDQEDNLDLFNIGYSSHSTTDEFTSSTVSFSYRNHRRDWFWPWQETTTQGLDWGMDANTTRGDMQENDFHAVQVLGVVGKATSKNTYVQIKYGPHALYADSGRSLIGSYSGSVTLGRNNRFSVQLKKDKDFIYDDAVIGGITKYISAIDNSASFHWKPYKRLRIPYSYTYREYVDHNKSHHSQLSMLYGFSTSWPWIWAGVGGERLTYDQQVDDYWSPDLFTSYGLRLDSSFPINKRLSGTAAANLDKIEEDGSKGRGYYVQAGLQYLVYKQVYIRLDLNRTKSIQKSSRWTENKAYLWFSTPFF